jgi:ABC-2 type transport system ATP-binding protein
MQLTIRNLSKTYPNGTQALKDVSLDIPAGMFGLLGRNGAGKSTLMRILATLQEPNAGTALLEDASPVSARIDVIGEKDRLRETLGYLPQSFGFHPRVSAERLLEHFAILKGLVAAGARRDVVESLLRRTNLWDVRGQRVGTFSGGMQQRLGVAIALLGSPKLIIVDEPTAGLDPEERVRFLNLLSEIGEGSVVILSTHIVEDVEELCSRLAIIDRGEILLEAEPARAIEQLRGHIWRKSVSRDELPRLEQELPVISTKLLAGRTIAHVYADAAPGASFEAVEPDLEDVYFSVMAGHHQRRTTAEVAS